MLKQNIVKCWISYYVNVRGSSIQEVRKRSNFEVCVLASVAKRHYIVYNIS